MMIINELIEQIKDLFTKRSNTIYEVRIVDERHTNKINVFFEYYKLEHATASRQIARLEGNQRDLIPTLVNQIKKETGLTVITIQNN